MKKALFVFLFCLVGLIFANDFIDPSLRRDGNKPKPVGSKDDRVRSAENTALWLEGYTGRTDEINMQIFRNWISDFKTLNNREAKQVEAFERFHNLFDRKLLIQAISSIGRQARTAALEEFIALRGTDRFTLFDFNFILDKYGLMLSYDTALQDYENALILQGVTPRGSTGNVHEVNVNVK
jgi:hypothetical protein